MRPRPWHDEALKLVELGVPISRVARKVKIDRKQIHLLLNPAYGARQASYRAEWRRQRIAADPAFAELEKARGKRSRIRSYARKEAAETGEPVEQVYERWGVA